MKLIKLYGLPRSGTNLLNFLMSLNFHETTCGFGEHNVHYLGWKHGKPSSIETVKVVEKVSGVDINFVFIIRDFEGWKEAILNRHLGNWEFPLHTFSMNEGELLYSTPIGYELYSNLEHLYEEYTTFYKNYEKQNPTKCILVYYKDLQKDQVKVILQIKERFGLSLVYPNPVPLIKQIQMSERI
jgi:hypothetical protein